MKKLILGIIFGILLIGASEVFAQNNDSEAVCNSEHLELCSGENECSDAGGYWNNSLCNNKDKQENQTNDNKNNKTLKGGITNINKTRIRERKKITFTPWQKMNESECLEGCRCFGAVVSCPTETGKIINITAGKSGNVITIIIDRIQVDTDLEIEVDNYTEGERSVIRIRVILPNGETKEIIMPDNASQMALKRLKLKNCLAENNCSIKLKEVGDKDKKLAYEIQAGRRARILWIFQKKMEVKARVNAETGELIRIKKPWWAFLASESEE